MNYKLITNPGHWFDVVETQTDQIVGTFTVYDEAKKFLRHLNLGGGFDGRTPTFFMKKINFLAKKGSNAV
jgi:hypothetical protein